MLHALLAQLTQTICLQPNVHFATLVIGRPRDKSSVRSVHRVNTTMILRAQQLVLRARRESSHLKAQPVAQTALLVLPMWTATQAHHARLAQTGSMQRPEPLLARPVRQGRQILTATLRRLVPNVRMGGMQQRTLQGPVPA